MVNKTCHKYKIVISKRFSPFKERIIVYANTDNLSDIETLIHDKLKKNYFSIVTANNRLYVISTYEIEKVEVRPLV